MKAGLPAVALVLGLVLPALAEVSFAGGDGRTKATAVLVQGAASDPEGVDAEYRWLDQHYPGLRATDQALLQDGSRVYDLLHLQSGARRIEVYFDITAFFGKP